jgi:creatinine amidohydrolase
MTAPEARLEFLLPDEIGERLTKRPVVYLPLGTIEWHCRHLPVGLDALTAHGVCHRAATQDGGIVYPALYYGTGGGHERYPWTIMMDSEREIAGELEKTLARLQDFGVRLVVLFSGHFADEQLTMIDEIAERWNASGRAMKVIATAVSRVNGLPFRPDHAGIFETTLLGGLWPDRVRIDKLAPREITSAASSNGDDRHDPQYPLWGVFGPDPRNYDRRQGPPLVSKSTDWLIGEVRRELNGSGDDRTQSQMDETKKNVE